MLCTCTYVYFNSLLLRLLSCGRNNVAIKLINSKSKRLSLFCCLGRSLLTLWHYQWGAFISGRPRFLRRILYVECLCWYIADSRAVGMGCSELRGSEGRLDPLSSWELLRRLRLLPCSQNVQSCYCKLECVIRGDELLDLTCKLGFLVGKCVTSLANMQGQIIHIYFGNTLPFRLLNWASAKGMERGLRDSWHEGLCVFMNVNNQKGFCNENPDCLLGLMIACLNIFA